jgi:lysozyme
MNRQLSPSGRAFLEAREGVVLHWYRDVAGWLTCGCGHKQIGHYEGSVFVPDEPATALEPITQAQCDAFLAHDVSKCEDAINAHIPPSCSQNQFDALVSLVFNIGVGAFEASTVLRIINGSTEMPLDQAWELWDKDVQHGAKVTDPGLLARRRLEVALYLTPDQATPDVA